MYGSDFFMMGPVLASPWGDARESISQGRKNKSAATEGVVATSALSVGAAAAPFAAAFPVGTAVVAGAATAAAIAGIIAAARKGKAARKAAAAYFRKRGVKDVDEIDGWVVRAAKWSSKKRRRKAAVLHKALQKKGAGLFRSERKVKVKLAVLSVLEKETKKNRKRIVKEDPSTAPDIAETTGDMDTPGDDALSANTPWLIAGAVGLLGIGATVLLMQKQKQGNKKD